MFEKSKVFHFAAFPWLFVNNQNMCTVMLRTGKQGDFDVYILYGDPCDFSGESDQKIPVLTRLQMTKAYTDGDYNYYQVTFSLKTHKLRYHFQIQIKDNVFIYSEGGIYNKNQECLIRPFYVHYTYTNKLYNAPTWVKNAVWYQIFPERFSNGTDINAEKFIPERDNFYGGNLACIREKLPYLKDLGITAIYFNPIFKSNSNHKYDIIDYKKIDPAFGTNEEFLDLVIDCHKKDIKIMLDGVFNHCSYDSEIWQDVKSKGANSKYYEWFIVYDEEALKWEDCRILSSERMKNNPPYETFAFAANMPKWNTQNTEVMDYLIGAAEYWTQCYEIDAWRLDVPDEVDQEFLLEFNKRIKKINPNIYITAEIWPNATPWFQKKLFDGVMNYPLYFAIRDFTLLHEDDAERFCDRLINCFVSYPEEVQYNLFNFCSNHDIPRALFLGDGNILNLKAAYLLLFLLPGSPSIYYGDEIGLTGGNDPDDRRAMPWNNMDHKLFFFFKTLISIRKKYNSFEGWTKKIQAIGISTITILLESENEQLIGFLNMGAKETRIKVNSYYNVLLGEIYMINGEIVIPAYNSGLCLVENLFK